MWTVFRVMWSDVKPSMSGVWWGIIFFSLCMALIFVLVSVLMVVEYLTGVSGEVIIWLFVAVCFLVPWVFSARERANRKKD